MWVIYGLGQPWHDALSYGLDQPWHDAMKKMVKNMMTFLHLTVRILHRTDKTHGAPAGKADPEGILIPYSTSRRREN